MVALKQAIGYADVNDYYDILDKTLGKGTFGCLHAGIHKRTGKEVAVKILRKKQANQEKIAGELNIMKVCQHPHIIRLLDLFEDDEYVYVIMEKCDGGDLLDYLD